MRWEGGCLNIKVDDRNSFQGNGKTARLVSLSDVTGIFAAFCQSQEKYRIMGHNPGNNRSAIKPWRCIPAAPLPCSPRLSPSGQ